MAVGSLQRRQCTNRALEVLLDLSSGERARLGGTASAVGAGWLRNFSHGREGSTGGAAHCTRATPLIVQLAFSINLGVRKRCPTFGTNARTNTAFVARIPEIKHFNHALQSSASIKPSDQAPIAGDL